MLKQSLFVEYSNINCLFDVVKALLRTKARIERENDKQARRIQRLLDDLGNYVEETLFQDHDNDDNSCNNGVGGGGDDDNGDDDDW